MNKQEFINKWSPELRDDEFTKDLDSLLDQQKTVEYCNRCEGKDTCVVKDYVIKNNIHCGLFSEKQKPVELTNEIIIEKIYEISHYSLEEENAFIAGAKFARDYLTKNK